MCCSRSVYVFLVGVVVLFVLFGVRASALPAVYATSLLTSVGRACASQAYGHGFDPHRGLVCLGRAIPKDIRLLPSARISVRVLSTRLIFLLQGPETPAIWFRFDHIRSQTSKIQVILVCCREICMFFLICNPRKASISM